MDREQHDEPRRYTPMNDLEVEAIMLNPAWGRERDQVSQELLNRLGTLRLYKDDQGNVRAQETSNLWGILSFYSRDMRLGNLSERELIYCQHYLDLANDALQENLIQTFLIALSRGATVLELSQSKKGFLRRNRQTIREEKKIEQIEPPKKGFFSSGGKPQQSY